MKNTIPFLAGVLVLGTPAFAIAQSEAEAPATDLAAEANETPRSDLELSTDTLGLAPEAIEKLSADQIVSLLKERERTRRKREAQPQLEGVVVPTAMFGFFALIIFLVVFFRYQRDRARHETLRAMVEKGADIPTELLVPPTQPTRKSDLRRGLVLLGLGLGSMGFIALLQDADKPAGLWGLGLIPALIGAGYLLTWRLKEKGAANGNGKMQGPAL